MIDAYEIGIQLLLQDGVSAGLAVINRELAEVNRSIAATSAGLNSLGQGAERRPGAVAAGTGRAAEAAGTVVQAEPVALSSGDMPKMAAPSQPADSPRSTVAPVKEDGREVAASIEKGSRERQPAEEAPSSRPREKEISSAPVVPVMSGKVEPEAEPVARAPTAPTVMTTSAPATASVSPAPAITATMPLPTARLASSTPPSRRIDHLSGSRSVTASVARAVAPPLPPARGGRLPPLSSSEGGAPVRQAATAPQSVRDGKAEAPRTSFGEREVAPPSLPREQNDSGTGTVMLDGRLVGYWLSEQMAREASRPPSGTSFFDPRQTPAWNVSGAL